MYPFRRKTFWIICVLSFAIILLFPPITGRLTSSYLPDREWRYMDWKLSFSIQPHESIHLRMLLFELQAVLYANYLGHFFLIKRKERQTG